VAAASVSVMRGSDRPLSTDGVIECRPGTSRCETRVLVVLPQGFHRPARVNQSAKNGDHRSKDARGFHSLFDAVLSSITMGRDRYPVQVFVKVITLGKEFLNDLPQDFCRVDRKISQTARRQHRR
jgi:hypothetical protein